MTGTGKSEAQPSINRAPMCDANTKKRPKISLSVDKMRVILKCIRRLEMEVLVPVSG